MRQGGVGAGGGGSSSSNSGNDEGDREDGGQEEGEGDGGSVTPRKKKKAADGTVRTLSMVSALRMYVVLGAAGCVLCAVSRVFGLGWRAR